MKISEVKDRAMVAILTGMLSVDAFAQTTLQLSDIKGTSGAGTNDLTALTNKGQNTFQKFTNFTLIAFCFVGIVLFAFGLYGFYKAGKDEGGRESMKGPIWACVIGASLTCIGLLIGLTRNTASV